MILGLHAPDGFLTPGVALVTGLLALGFTVFALRGAEAEVGDRQVPLVGITAAFVFAAQMVNFPVAAGTTGHLVGATLAAILLGPRLGSLVVIVVVIVQALLFADGGLTALGYNIINMAIVPAYAGWALFGLFRRLLPQNAGGVIGSTALASGMGVVLGAAAFSVEWLFGASAPVAADTVFGAMVGVHVLIGIGEGVISGLVIAAVLAARPDLVRGAEDLDRAALDGGPRVGPRPFVIGSVLAALCIATVVAQFAADEPDGLERVADEQGFAEQAEDSSLADTLFADYALDAVDDERLTLAIAGAAGTLITLLVGVGAARAGRAGRRRPATSTT